MKPVAGYVRMFPVSGTDWVSLVHWFLIIMTWISSVNEHVGLVDDFLGGKGTILQMLCDVMKVNKE